MRSLRESMILRGSSGSTRPSNRLSQTSLLRLFLAAMLGLFLVGWHPQQARALPPETLASVVSVLPQWPGYPRRPAGSQAGDGAERLEQPEGSGVVIAEGGIIATAYHVIEPATGVQVRLSDGRVLRAQRIGDDPATDISLLRVEADLPVLEPASSLALATPVCAVGNAFGLDLSVTCGVVSALNRAGVGFNPIEDFVQTDASVNPGASGGALVTKDGALVGMLSAIFTRGSDADIGVNFAVSEGLLRRVASDLLDDGEVDRVTLGMRLAPLPAADRATIAGVLVASVTLSGMADKAGLRRDDIILSIAGRRTVTGPELVAAVHVHKRGQTVEVDIQRGSERLRLPMLLQ